jgi:hypothetical protein
MSVGRQEQKWWTQKSLRSLKLKPTTLAQKTSSSVLIARLAVIVFVIGWRSGGLTKKGSPGLLSSEVPAVSASPSAAPSMEPPNSISTVRSIDAAMMHGHCAKAF